MPRKARVKRPEGIFHVMCRSISEVNLFKDDTDRIKYLSLMKKYQKIYEFKVYGYCLMDTHGHLIIDANGADISRVLHSINFAYAQYFNRRHKRHGHLFQDRFKSKMVEDERYLLTLSAYVHSNPVDISEYSQCPQRYEFSSLSTYLGLREDPYEILDVGFITGIMGSNAGEVMCNYLDLVLESSDEKIRDEVEFVDEGTDCKSYRKILVRKVDPNEIISFVAAKMNVADVKLHAKNARKVVEAKAMVVLLMRSLCNFKCSEICGLLGNIGQVRVSKLSSRGLELLDESDRCAGIFREFMSAYAA
jgi:putative transposase